MLCLKCCCWSRKMNVTARVFNPPDEPEKPPGEPEKPPAEPEKPPVINPQVVDERRPGIREHIPLDNNVEIEVTPKSDHDKEIIKKAISSNEFLENILQGKILDVIVDAMYSKEVAEGEVIIQEGEPGSNMYVSDQGTFEVYVKNKLVSSFSDQKVFGELAVLYNNKRLATIKAITSGKIWVLPRVVYQQSLIKDAMQYMNETFSFLKNVPMINKLREEKLRIIADLLKKEVFKPDTVIVKEGDVGDKFYIIRAGSVTVTKNGEGKVGELGKGEFFGERALLYSDTRQATVTAQAPSVECLTLTRTQFQEHFDPNLLKVVDDKIEDVQEQDKTPKREMPSTSAGGEYSDIKLADLTMIATLGVGGFGRVELVQHKKQKDLTFALKYLKKADMVEQSQVEHVYNERNIQIKCNSIFIVRLYNTFKDQKYLYFLMESCLGGDLWAYLQKRKNKCVSDQDARFFAGCVLEAFAYLHERKYIYRDLKPENLLIDAQGYIKLTDFGFAKHLGDQLKTFTFAGTPEYVAPEIIYNKGHDKSADYWTFGILIFELLVGRTPFRAGDDYMKTYNRILKGINAVTFPQHVSRSAVNIILKLCRPTPTERLGLQKNGIDDIRNHKWFQGFEWNKLRSKKMKAPYVPKLTSNIDVRNIDSFKKDDDIPPDSTEFDQF
ncbi:cGMP-dependent protein kinase, isozyme 1-like isoform X2 [Onthophagus taurus]|uniref:cGMP-dependent protein kinase, isozyme 1-like isoform X2 n=1 Tax=Onthophagus taurus TaxID=166361 RepID=UPI000C20AEF6|nr:cGMP-dependent protein kinase, isozyme 1-like isoform X2 [Onthophagus taurus]XP_022914388.1 cGMP-dependent protein kinase, isozyme 1-like isoform X2 [Onthophagus taurus]